MPTTETPTRLVAQSVAGTDLKIGDLIAFGWTDHQTITKATPGQLPAGARYVDIETDTGYRARCWGGFVYSRLTSRPK